MWGSRVFPRYDHPFINDSEFYEVFDRKIDNLLERGAKFCYLMSPDRPNFCVGALVFETCATSTRPCIHFAYVLPAMVGKVPVLEAMCEMVGINLDKPFHITFRSFLRQYPAAIYAPTIAEKESPYTDVYRPEVSPEPASQEATGEDEGAREVRQADQVDLEQPVADAEDLCSGQPSV